MAEPFRLRRALLAAALCGVLSATIVLAADRDCAVVFKALENVVTTPAHVWETQTSPRGTTETETIHLDGKSYVRLNGRWRLNPVPSVEAARQLKQRQKHSAMSCQLVGEEKIGDRVARVYASQWKTSDSEHKARLWIDAASGLLWKQEEEMTAGPGTEVHRSARYEYGNVKAPKVEPE